VETVLFVISLSNFWLSFIDVDDAPLLVDTIVSVISNNTLHFIVFTAMDIKSSFVIDILDMSTIELEHLPPST
jgi:hypothetical protein